MCGIGAILKFDSKHIETTELKRMASVMRHRGPDEAGFAVIKNGQVGLVHVRLSIIDLQTGQQPMFSEDCRIAIIMNGEIYDYKRHREDLQKKGYRFQTTSDTEVVINLYREYGLKFLDKLNGEYAFLLYDVEQSKCYMVRDRSGVKPLFYRNADHEIQIASEAKAILSLPRVPREISPDYLTGPMLGAFPKSYSAFQGINSLPPGHYLEIQPHGSCSEHEYWSMKYTPDHNLSFEDAKQKVRHTFNNAVRKRMIADVPIGVCLSGGVDSTIICATMAKHTSELSAFTVSFPGCLFDESSLSQTIAHHYGAKLETVDGTMEKMANQFENAVFHLESAFSNPNTLGKFLLSKLIRNNSIKVCLTGEGADEVFGGYPFFKLEKLWQMYRKGDRHRSSILWERFQKMEVRSAGLLWSRTKKWKHGNHCFGYPSHHEILHRSMRPLSRRLFRQEQLNRCVSKDTITHFLNNFPPDQHSKLLPFNSTRKISFNHLYGYIIPMLGDRPEMANAVECRTPFLDKDLLELAGKISPEYFLRIDDLREKWILRRAFNNDLPDFLQGERKHPYLAPGWHNFVQSKKGAELFEDFTSTKELQKVGIFRPSTVRAIKYLWRTLPHSSIIARRVDALMGMIVSAQVLHNRFIQTSIAADLNFKIMDHSPSAQELYKV